jgi:hypothetical protein
MVLMASPAGSAKSVTASGLAMATRGAGTATRHNQAAKGHEE